MSLDAESRLRRVEGVEASHFGGEYVVLEPGGKTLRGLNKTAGRVWELLDGQRSVAEVARQLSEEVNAPLARVTADVLALLGQLLERKLVEVATTSAPAETHPRSSKHP